MVRKKVKNLLFKNAPREKLSGYIICTGCNLNTL